MNFQSSFARQQAIQGWKETIIIDFVVGDAQQIAQSRAAKPIFGNVQLT